MRHQSIKSHKQHKYVMHTDNNIPNPEQQPSQALYPHVSIDCVILGFDGDSLQVLLSQPDKDSVGNGFTRAKLPGRLLYAEEDPEDAASDIINQLTGTRNHYVKQFRAFGSPTRTSNPKDVHWLESIIRQKVGRIVTIAYLSLVKINNRTHRKFAGFDAEWHKLSELPELAFDHHEIIAEVLKELDELSGLQPQIIFEMLPAKFTALQLRHLYEQISGKEIDVRNFSKLVLSKPYIIPLDEWEQNVSHRAARYYKFQASRTKM